MQTLFMIFVFIPVAVIAFFFAFLPWLAKENILVTTVKEGTAKAIMRGKSFHHFVMSFRGHHLNVPGKPGYKSGEPTWQVLDHSKGNTLGFTENGDRHYDDRNFLMRYLGLYWVGWPWNSGVYIYPFEWNETYTDLETGKEKILPRAEPTDFIYVNDFTYAIVTDGAETKDRLPTDEQTLVTVAVCNPYRALFGGEDWMRRITAAINRHVREFVGDRLFQKLIQKSERQAFSQPIIDLARILPDDGSSPSKGLRGRYGIDVRTADLQTIALSGDAKKRSEEATTREYTAKQEARATVLIGKAEAEVIKVKGNTEAESLEKRLAVIQKYGPAGLALAGYDAVQEAAKGEGKTVIWANNPLNALPEAAKALGEVLKK